MGRTCVALIRELTKSTSKRRITKQKYREGRFTPYLTPTLISSPSSFSSSSSPLCRYLVDLGLLGFWFFFAGIPKGRHLCARSVRFLCKWGRAQSATAPTFPLKFFNCGQNFCDIQIFIYFHSTSITGDQIFLLSQKNILSAVVSVVGLTFVGMFQIKLTWLVGNKLTQCSFIKVGVMESALSSSGLRYHFDILIFASNFIRKFCCLSSFVCVRSLGLQLRWNESAFRITLCCWRVVCPAWPPRIELKHQIIPLKWANTHRHRPDSDPALG